MASERIGIFNRLIDKEDVKKFYIHLLDLRYGKNKEQYADSYIKDILAELKTLFLAYRPDSVPKFPDHTIIPKREKQWLGIERQMAVEPSIPNKYSLPIRVLQFTGMRQGELRALQVDDMVDGVLRVWKAFNEQGLKLSRKSGGEVIAPLSLDLWEELKEHTQGKGPDDFIFTHPDGKPFGPNCLPRAWEKACKKAGVKKIPLQQASRHSAASRIMKEAKEEAIRRIQDTLGHHNQNTAKKHYVLE